MKGQQKRFVSLDVFRGMTIALMILVNTPGTWAHVYAPLRHAKWHGCTLTDLVFPFFLFIVGTAMRFSFRKYDFILSTALTRKILRRVFIIFFFNSTPERGDKKSKNKISRNIIMLSYYYLRKQKSPHEEAN